MIIIPALTGITNEHNLNETLKLTPVQASWLGKFNEISGIFYSLLSLPQRTMKHLKPISLKFFILLNSCQFILQVALVSSVNLLEVLHLH